ncbi:PP2C family protein-serine/threonine phosphatase [Brumicola pallidula]|jgi:PAS domain S-box-containing protein|uniref:Sigma-B regulation protein RsbU n=1 Tax=Brumicola pallidula DSM 14239 = ACAM 615 TaxID=1121922 RepID=K6ZHY4_9ALTE|nr:PP2C family protein-serine/threonine phosphatase [Glaciecola pallidula]GAC28503.1 sigma-B regulation protein RsbU [Glaciecola pallidula DSM 14239 = ACAM 615]
MWKTDNHSIRESLDLLQLAIDGAKDGITIADMQHPDLPLIFVNEGFEHTTGYKREEVLGRNCRFLQGANQELENQVPLSVLKKALYNAESCTVLLKNYHKNGDLFWNRLSLTPIFNQEKILTHFVGVQTDITAEILATEAAAKANKQLKENFAIMEQDLAHASFVQQSILPTKFPDSKCLHFSAKFEPMTHIGGDFYDIFEIEANIYGVMIADVTGHGASAALLTLMTFDMFKEAAKANCNPEDVLRKTNQKLYKRIPPGKFITMFYGVINENAKTFSYCQAGHPCGYLIKGEDQSIHELTTKCSLLGVFNDSMAEFEPKTIALATGDKVVLYTDAIIEAQAQDQSYFGSDKLSALLSEIALQPIDQVLEHLYRSGLAFIDGGEHCKTETTASGYQDDVTLLGFEVSM